MLKTALSFGGSLTYKLHDPDLAGQSKGGVHNNVLNHVEKVKRHFLFKKH